MMYSHYNNFQIKSVMLIFVYYFGMLHGYVYILTPTCVLQAINNKQNSTSQTEHNTNN